MQAHAFCTTLCLCPAFMSAGFALLLGMQYSSSWSYSVDALSDRGFVLPSSKTYMDIVIKDARIHLNHKRPC